MVADGLTINGRVRPPDVLSRIVNFHSTDDFYALHVSKGNIDVDRSHGRRFIRERALISCTLNIFYKFFYGNRVEKNYSKKRDTFDVAQKKIN